MFSSCWTTSNTIKSEWQNRNRIKTAQGVQWLTVPVTYSFPAAIVDVQVNQQVTWSRKEWQALTTNYGKASHLGAMYDRLSTFYNQDWAMLHEVNRASIDLLREQMGVDTPLRTASDIDASSEPIERLLDICRAVGPTSTWQA